MTIKQCGCTKPRRSECVQAAPFGFRLDGDDMTRCQLFEEEDKEACSS